MGDTDISNMRQQNAIDEYHARPYLSRYETLGALS